MKNIKQLLKEKEIVVGLTLQQVCAPWVAKVYADAGADFIFVENEHMFFNEADLASFILSSKLLGLPVVAKSPYVNKGAIAKMLDSGITGIQLPLTESSEQLAKVVSYTKFPPLGNRTAGPGIGNTNYEPVDTAQWVKQANEDTCVIAHIESKAGLENIDDILQVPHVDIMFIGMFDLTVSLGYPAKFNNPDIVAAVELLIGAANDHGKVVGMWAPRYELAHPWIKKGVRFFEGMGDVGFLGKGAMEFVKSFPGHQPRIAQGDGHI